MARRRRWLRWTLLVLVLFVIVSSALFARSIYLAQKARPDRAFGTVTWIFNARSERIKQSPWAQEKLRTYIHHLFETEAPWQVAVARREEPKPDYRIVAVGDSQTAGRKLSEKQRWTYFLEKLIAYHMPGKTVRVVNAGIPGNTIHEVHGRLLRDVISLAPDLVIMNVGFNDSRAIGLVDKKPLPLVPLDEYTKMYAQAAVAIKHKIQTPVILWSPPPVGPGFRSNLGPDLTGPQQELFQTYVPVPKALSEAIECGFADVNEYIASNQLAGHAYFKDGIHLNTAGHLLAVKPIFDAWLEMEGIEAKEPFLVLIRKAIGPIELVPKKRKKQKKLLSMKK
jgi:lysophospholipase L1-like esterase